MLRFGLHLMHELYHILNDYQMLSEWKYHLTGEVESEIETLSEPMADHFACEMLFPRAKLSYISNLISSHNTVLKYAKDNRVHPSIIYNFYCFDAKEKKGLNQYPFYSKYFGNAEVALKLVRTNPFEKKNIAEAVVASQSILQINNN